MLQELDIVKAALLLIVMVPACISDLRRREVSDLHWWIIGAVGIACMLITSFTVTPRWEHLTMIIGTLMILISILREIPGGRYGEVMFHLIAAVLFIAPLLTSWDDVIVRQFLAVPVMFLVYLAMFHLGVVKGGADAKFLIVLTMLFQTYPEWGSFPFIAVPISDISMIFQFSLAVLFHAALFSMLASLYYIVLNIRNGDRRVPSMFIGYRMDIGAVRHSYVWPMEKAVDGAVVITNRAQTTDVLDDLEVLTDRIWVTPMVPFMIPLTIAVVFVMFIGNMLFLPF